MPYCLEVGMVVTDDTQTLTSEGPINEDHYNSEIRFHDEKNYNTTN